MRKSFVLALVMLAGQAQAVDPECMVMDDPNLDTSISWGQLDLTDGACIRICSPLFTIGGFRVDPITKADSCTVNIGANSYEMTTDAGGQVLTVCAGAEIFTPSGQATVTAYCSSGANQGDAVMTVVPVPVSEPLTVPLLSAP